MSRIRYYRPTYAPIQLGHGIDGIYYGDAFIQRGRGIDRIYHGDALIQRGRGIGLGSYKYYESPYFIQRGHGLGSLFRSIGSFLIPVAKKIFPAAKSVAKKVVKSQAAKNIAKELKDSAIDAGLNLAETALTGGDLKESAKAGFEGAKKRVTKAAKREIDKKVSEYYV